MRMRQINGDEPEFLAYRGHIDLRGAVIVRDLPLFPRGDTHHPMAPGDGKFVVDDAFIRDMLASYQAITSQGYMVPYLEEHTPNGRVCGMMSGLRGMEQGPFAILHDAMWIPSVHAEVERGERAYISPSFRTLGLHPHTGQELPNLLRETSFVSVPHLKGLPPLSEIYRLSDMPTLGHSYALSDAGYLTTCSTTESSMSTETPEPTGNETTEETPLDAASILQAIEGLAMRVDNLQANLQTTPEGAPPVDNTEDASLRDELAEIKGKLALAEARATYAAQMPGADADAITAVAALSLSNPEQADKLVKMHATAPTPPTPIVGAQGTPTGSLTVPQAFAAAEKKLGAAASFSEVWAEVKTQIPSATIGDLD
jgi:hypothetical protein